jgi:hypothetical protein
LATHTVPSSRVGVHGITLTANTEEIINFADDVSTLEILSMDGASPIYFTVNGTAATVGGSHTRVLPAAVCSVVISPTSSDPTSVSLISAGTPTVSVARA